MIISTFEKEEIPFKPCDAKRIGKRCFYTNIIVWLNSEFIELGDDVGFNYGCYVNGFGGLTIDDRTIIGPYVMIHTANHESDPDKPFQVQGRIKLPVSIGRDCWIGMGAIILPGVKIEDGVIIGAGSVVTKDISSYTVAVGNPCKVIKERKRNGKTD